MELLNDILAWAWGRHHNILSWYIRPLFVLPFAYYSYRRSPRGIALTLVALATSMFWFPAPEHVDPRVEEFLRMEQAFLTDLTPARALQLLLVPTSLGLLCLAFWKRSLPYGLGIINAMAVGKLTWGLFEGSSSGLAMLAPALVGLVICNAAVLYVAHKLRLRDRGAALVEGSALPL